MKIKQYFALLAVMLTMPCLAQRKYTEVIQQSSQGEGTLVIHQSKSISDLVNGEASGRSNPVETTNQVEGGAGSPAVVASPDTSTVVRMGQRTLGNGYRIQVFSGDNTRKGKVEAAVMRQKVKNLFGDLPVYTHFVSPHWICRAGDFRTYEEANEYFKRFRDSGAFPEAVIVRSKVTVYD